MQGTIVETARIRLRDGVSQADLIAASDRFQKAFLDGQPGFLRRELVGLDDREFLDIVHWRNRNAADAVMERAMTSDHCREFFALMEMDTADVGAGVRLYTSLATYGSI